MSIERSNIGDVVAVREGAGAWSTIWIDYNSKLRGWIWNSAGDERSPSTRAWINIERQEDIHPGGCLAFAKREVKVWGRTSYREQCNKNRIKKTYLYLCELPQ